MASTLNLLKRLNDAGVQFVIVGGMAGVLHGSSIVTHDLDVCSPFDQENMVKILNAMNGIHPRYRMNPKHPSLSEDPKQLEGVKNLYLLTDYGQIDFLGEITGVGDYAEVSRHTIKATIGGIVCQALDLETLIRAKKAIARPKDLQTASELEAIRKKIGD